jgi:hypothetical protein
MILLCEKRRRKQVARLSLNTKMAGQFRRAAPFFQLFIKPSHLNLMIACLLPCSFCVENVQKNIALKEQQSQGEEVLQRAGCCPIGRISLTVSLTNNCITGKIFINFKEPGYESVALETLYNFSFECVKIGRSVRPQIHENVGSRRHLLTSWQLIG